MLRIPLEWHWPIRRASLIAIHRLFTHPARASVQLACDLIAAPMSPDDFEPGTIFANAALVGAVALAIAMVLFAVLLVFLPG